MARARPRGGKTKSTEDHRLLRELRDRISDAMAAQSLIKANVADQLGLSHSTVSEWWTQRAGPSAASLMRLPQILQLNGHYLLTGNGPRTLPDTAHEPLVARGALLTLASLENWIVAERAQWTAGRLTPESEAEAIEQVVREVLARMGQLRR